MATLTATATAAPPCPSALAFGEGSDARLAGRPLEANPYGEGDPRAHAWANGWRDVDSCWASEARWAHRDLPAVRRGCGT